MPVYHDMFSSAKSLFVSLPVMNVSSTVSVLLTEPTDQHEDNVQPEDADDGVACVMIVVRSLSPLEFCRDQRPLRENIASQLINE